MAVWIWLAVSAQFLSAIVALLDKYIVSNDRVLPRPFVYAFITCLFSGASIIVYAFSGIPIPVEGLSFPDIRNVTFPTLGVVAFSFLSAYTFFSALVSMFSALKAADASDVVPVVGSVSAISTFLLGFLFLGTTLSPNFIIGIILLSLGTLLVSRLRFTWRVALLSLHAGLFFGLHYVTFKGLLSLTSFDNAFFWSRIGFVAFALSLLLVPEYFEKIRSQRKSSNTKAGLLVVGNKIIAGVAALLILKATELGDAAVVQALGGLQFVFILVLGILVGGKYISVEYEKSAQGMQTKDFLHKALFVAVITLGFFVLFV